MRIAFGYTYAMSMVKEIRLRLPQDEYDQLIAEAGRRGLSPDALARTYLRERLSVDASDASASKERQAGIQALEELQALRQRLPAADPIDVVELIRQGRDDLSRRTVG